MDILTRISVFAERTVGMPRGELFNTISHCIGALASLLVTIVYFRSSNGVDAWLTASVVVSGSSYIILFVASALYHANKNDPSRERFWLKLDHCAIFIMMAGSYVGPLYIFAPWEMFRSLITAIWLAALLGMVLKLRYTETSNRMNFAIHAPLGVVSLVPMYLLWNSVDSIPAHIMPIPVLKSLLVAGLVIYGIAGIIYAAKRPDPRPDILGFHGVFHLLILAGAGLHALALYFSILSFSVIRQFQAGAGVL